MQGKRERNWRHGEALWQGGMAAIRPSQLTKKSLRIWGGHNNHQLHSCHYQQDFSFLPIQIFIYLNIFECPTNGFNDNTNITQHMLPKRKATTSHNFNSLSEQSSSSHIGSIINNNNNVHHQSNSKYYKWQTACSPI
jgi:hypothetical protein